MGIRIVCVCMCISIVWIWKHGTMVGQTTEELSQWQTAKKLTKRKQWLMRWASGYVTGSASFTMSESLFQREEGWWERVQPLTVYFQLNGPTHSCTVWMEGLHLHMHLCKERLTHKHCVVWCFVFVCCIWSAVLEFWISTICF